MRQIVLDTETTGLDPGSGHRIIEIGCVELINRRPSGNTFHQYLQPDREIDAGAIEVHGITNEMLADKPHFADIAQMFGDFIRGAELVIHNAPFDLGFIRHEFKLLNNGLAYDELQCQVLDTLVMARQLHPGQRNNLDALCKRYGIDNTQRELHGALLDAEILADVYLAMTGGQVTLSLGGSEHTCSNDSSAMIRRLEQRSALCIVRANEDELAIHEQSLQAIGKASGGRCLWQNMALAALEDGDKSE
ncbi:MAG: DNA polymerase III subunit epsilon [Thiohalomonadaceae bacterium]